MKKNFAFLCGLFILSNAFGQESVKFTMSLSPNKSYAQVLVQKIKIEFNMDSGANRSGNPNFPAKKEQEIHLESVTKTGAVNSQTGKMPVVMTISGGDSNTTKFLKPGTQFIGNAGLNELPVYDSISGMSMDTKQKTLMMKVLSNLSKISLPSGNLKPGETDTVRTAFDNPMGGGGQMDFITIFRLKSIQASAAFFDIKVDIHFNITTPNKTIPGSGSGVGSMEYDTKNHYPSSYNLSYQLNMDFPISGKSSGMKMSTDMKTTYKVTSL